MPSVQVRFGVLNAGNFGVSQSRKRTFIWAAAPGETLPSWPQPLTVFKSPQLCINLPGGISYKAVEDGKNARLRAVTVKDAIHDLPPVANGAEECAPLQPRSPLVRMDTVAPPVCLARPVSLLALIWAATSGSEGCQLLRAHAELHTCITRNLQHEVGHNTCCRHERPYAGEPVSGFQRAIRGKETVLKDHVCKTMNELNMRRCALVPKNTPGADWRAIVLHVRDHPADETFNVRAAASFLSFT
jgi:hypothetical protein